MTMTHRFTSGALRTALVCGTSAVALALSPLAYAQQTQSEESTVRLLRYGLEVSDGTQVTSRSQDMVMARERVGDRSLLLYDLQNGAITIESQGQTRVRPIISQPGVERAFAYDYTQRRVSGDTLSTSEFNTYVRPLLASSPALGADTSWTVTTDLAAIGLLQTGDAPLSISLSRKYLRNNDVDVVLVEFEIPVFRYTTPNGAMALQWARGFAVTDPGFGQIHAVATQHRATVMASDGAMRPVSVRTSLHGIDRAGDWLMTFENAPEIRAAVARVMETSGDLVHAIVDADESASADMYPATIAAKLDFAAFSAGENSANGLGLTLDAAGSSGGAASAPAAPSSQTPTAGSLGGRTFTPEELAQMEANGGFLPFRTPDNDPDMATMGQFIEELMQGGMFGLAGNDMGLEFADPADEAAAMIAMMAEYMSGSGPSGAFGQTSSGMTLGGRTYTPAELAQMEANGGFLPFRTPDNDPDMAAMRQYIQQLMQGDMFRQSMADMNLQPGNPADELDALVAMMAAAAADGGAGASASDILATVEAMRENADGNGFAPWLQYPDDEPYPGDLPGWLIEEYEDDPEAARRSEEQWRLLIAKLEREIEDARRDAKRAEQRRASGIDNLDEFVQNNAFLYTSLVGVVATDLSRWAEWLMTQNVRELERLALTAGYPNLASALADAQNILRQSQDPGYREWAMQAPSCAGPAGCGPNYLERWHMKTSIVALGDILADSRGIFSSGGFSDIGISGLNLNYLLRDHAVEDGDIVRVRISQFGRLIYEGEISLTNLGQIFNLGLGRGVASLEIFAVNEGTARPNTAQITVDKVVRGQATQTYSLATGETATLRIEAGAMPGPTSGPSKAGQ